MKIIIGADLVPTKSNEALFAGGDVDTLVGEEIKGILESADYTIFNLETPLTDAPDPIEKCGPNLCAPTSTIKGLRGINPHFFTLANNHIMDQGEDGLKSTLETLKSNNISYSGVGENLQEASKPYVINFDNLSIGIYCCAEHEFSIATEQCAGANPFDPLESLDHVADLKKSCDYVIVLYHGGKEQYRYPSPMLQKTGRKLIDKGADLVISQHSHCIGCREEWNGGTIVYGQGNFLFDHSESEYWKTALLMQVEIEKKEKEPLHVAIGYIPVVKEENKVRSALDDKRKKIMESFYQRSEEIKNPQSIAEHYRELAEEKQWEYLNMFAGKTTKNFFYRAINRISGYRFYKYWVKKHYQFIERIIIQNHVECEAHRELLLYALSQKGTK